ncbi:unnamed protein product [Moneuplotes crassus]|uniref:B box-type domain-containing protein n=1 Tax=Euplotes crassus TaxID=5936 RepID=A0AAD1YA98_EUPCR|nr:unnamed protein product [Moneuplotes crassus]
METKRQENLIKCRSLNCENDIKFYCEHCNTKICRDCRIDFHSTCNPKMIDTKTDGLEKKVKELGEVITRIKIISEIYEDSCSIEGFDQVFNDLIQNIYCNYITAVKEAIENGKYETFETLIDECSRLEKDIISGDFGRDEKGYNPIQMLMHNYCINPKSPFDVKVHNALEHISPFSGVPLYSQKFKDIFKEVFEKYMENKEIRDKKEKEKKMRSKIEEEISQKYQNQLKEQEEKIASLTLQLAKAQTNRPQAQYLPANPQATSFPPSRLQKRALPCPPKVRTARQVPSYHIPFDSPSAESSFDSDSMLSNSYNAMDSFSCHEMYSEIPCLEFSSEPSFVLELDSNEQFEGDDVGQILASQTALLGIKAVRVSNISNDMDKVNDFLQHSILQQIPSLSLSCPEGDLFGYACGILDGLMCSIGKVSRDLSFNNIIFTREQLSAVVIRARHVEKISFHNCDWNIGQDEGELQDFDFKLSEGKYKINTLSMSYKNKTQRNYEHAESIVGYGNMIYAISESGLRESLKHLNILDGLFGLKDEIIQQLSSSGLSHIILGS